MRLKDWEIRTIRETADEIFGPDVRVYLFGSRTDDSVRGGDIDLYVESDREIEHDAKTSARFGARLKRRLGDQKIDVVVWDPTTKTARIHERARETGIELTR